MNNVTNKFIEELHSKKKRCLKAVNFAFTAKKGFADTGCSRIFATSLLNLSPFWTYVREIICVVCI